LHPPLLEEAGLASAIDWYVEGFAARSGIRAKVEIAETLGRLGNDIELVLFRVLQESLTNVHRHSGSKSAPNTQTNTPVAKIEKHSATM
jgi:two-component system, NarL family, sensor kinase